MKTSALLTFRKKHPLLPFTTDYTGKVAGSVVECPHTMKRGDSSVLKTPIESGWTEESTGVGGYSDISSLNGVVRAKGNTINASLSQHFFSFNLIQAIERKYGKIPSADKVAWLKANIAQITCNWWGYGSSPTGNKASLAMWLTDTVSWFSYSNTTSGSVAKVSSTYTAVNTKIDINGFVHFLAYADPSNGTIASTINTDYVSLDIQFKTGVQL